MFYTSDVKCAPPGSLSEALHQASLPVLPNVVGVSPNYSIQAPASLLDTLDV